MSLEKNVIEEQSINDVNYELLKKQFPHAISIDENGKYVIDPQKLQMSLDPSKAEIKEDGYGLNWVGKKEAYHNAFTKNYKVLKPLKDDSKNWDETENILIKGDNLDALKILRQNYFESIKMIYIDPPYNTKNDGFVYNDDFTTSTEQTLEELGYDEEYIDYIENIQGAKTHSGWLSFMYPRLLLAFDLLKDEGLICISIDDNEIAQLKILCNEIFGESNFVGELAIVNNIAGRSDKKNIATAHEYILCYQKSDSFNANGLPLTEEQLKDYKYLDPTNNKLYRSQGLRKRGSGSKREDRPNLFYYFLYNEKTNDLYPTRSEDIPNGYIQIKPTKESGEDGNWRWELTTAEKNLDFLIPKYMSVRKKWGIFEKDLLENKKAIKPTSAWTMKNVNSERGTEQFINLGFKKEVFPKPKPIGLIQNLMEFGLDKDDIILDFFSGSGTTGHAVLDLNKDGGNRKFILIQLPDLIDKKKNQTAYDFVHNDLKKKVPTIFDITKERINRAGDQIAKGDIGFRTFEIVEDQKQKIYQKSLKEVNQDDLLSLMEKPDISSNEEILYNLFVAETLPLSTKHQELIKNKLYLASNVAFILGDITSNELVEALKDKKECEYITVYSPNISDDKFTLEIESNISKLGIKSDKLRFRG